MAGERQKRVLMTGASGCVGMYLVQFAVAAGHRVVAATSFQERSGEFLESIGAHKVIECSESSKSEPFDRIVGSVGFQVLSDCWSVAKPGGTLVSFDSCNWAYREEHKSKGISREDVRALYFIVELSRVSMEGISRYVLKGNVKGHVMETVALDKVRVAYESVHLRGLGHGKIVILP